MALKLQHFHPKISYNAENKRKQRASSLHLGKIENYTLMYKSLLLFVWMSLSKVQAKPASYQA